MKKLRFSGHDQWAADEKLSWSPRRPAAEAFLRDAVVRDIFASLIISGATVHSSDHGAAETRKRRSEYSPQVERPIETTAVSMGLSHERRFFSQESEPDYDWRPASADRREIRSGAATAAGAGKPEQRCCL